MHAGYASVHPDHLHRCDDAGFHFRGISSTQLLNRGRQIEVGFLAQAGGETPMLLQRAPTTMRPGGGVDPMFGNFDTMDSDIKIISVIGGTQIEGRVTVASTGKGS